ncbi:MAG: dTDP-4-dehydrorhamnose 3,5-epimerase [Bacteroidota bacterium]
MEIIKTPLADLLIIQPQVFRDERGYFFESFSAQRFIDAGLDLNFVQDNESKSQKNVLRGLHFQSPPFAQGKLVRVIKGSVMDVVVDIRKDSLTYGKHYKLDLTETNKTMLWIPPGFAHGFATLEDDTIFSYKCTNTYNKLSEGAILWNDPDLNIDWDIAHPILSEKDKISPFFRDFVSGF